MSAETKRGEFSRAEKTVETVSAELSTRRVAKYSAQIQEKFRALFKMDGLLFTNVELSIEIRGVPTAVPNLLRATFIDGIKGRVLTPGKIVTTDPHILEQLVRTQLAGIQMRPQIPDSILKKVKFRLFYENKTQTVATVYSGELSVAEGKLTEPLFDPTWVIAQVAPGKMLRIEDIGFAEGYGGFFQVGIHAVSRPLDVEAHPASATHPVGAPLVDESGYKVSTLVANPRRHRVSVEIQAVPENVAEAVAVGAEVCKNIKKRLELVLSALESKSRVEGAQFSLTTTDADKGGLSVGRLRLERETDQFGVLLTRLALETDPDLLYAGYTNIAHHRAVEFTVTHQTDARDVIRRTAKRALAIFDVIQKQFR